MMRVHTHTRFCFLCVLTLLFHQCSHCHEGGSHHHHGHSHEDHNHDHVHNDLQISEMSCEGLSERLLHNDHGEPAENEQRYYIQRLFCLYGKKDRLDFKGFQSLLLSLGLGEVRVVGLEHEELGHDHMAHLDILEVQEGRHSHSAGHNHHVSHKNHEHSHQENEEHTSVEEPPCADTTTARSEKHDHEKDGGHDVDHDHDNDTDHEHRHDPQNHEHTHSHGHHSDQLDHEHDHHREPTRENNDLSEDHGHEHEHHHHDHHHHKHPHPHLHHTTVTPSTPTEPPNTQLRRNRRPPKARNQRGRNKTTGGVTHAVSSPEPESSGDEHNSQEHSLDQPPRGKREVPGRMMDPSDKLHTHGVHHQHEEVNLNLNI